MELQIFLSNSMILNYFTYISFTLLPPQRAARATSWPSHLAAPSMSSLECHIIAISPLPSYLGAPAIHRLKKKTQKKKEKNGATGGRLGSNPRPLSSQSQCHTTELLQGF
jgi:hypothetical protein